MEITIRNGRIRGIAEQGMLAFKGIPFAKPPVGALRFRPPEPCADWDGVLDATQYAPRPCQLPPPWCLDRDTFPYGEDCLNINVWTPAADSGKRPVVFNIFGGGHMEGSNSELGREGYHFADALGDARDIVFVAPNYRLGPFGYLYLGHLLGEDYAASGSLGQLDLILALLWVRDNIAAFGGDPDNVTIIGQSAGGKSVCNLLLAPAAKGLFHKVVSMSGAFQSISDMATDIALTRHFLDSLGWGEQQAEKLLTCPAEVLTKHIDVASQTYFKAESYGPTADGIALPRDIDAYIQAGNLPDVPLMLGHTREELHLPLGADTPDPGDEAVYQKLVWKFGNNADHVMAQYRTLRTQMSYADAFGRIATDYTYVQAYLRAADLLTNAGKPVYLYRWDYTGGYRANHSSDNEALFGATNADKQRHNPALTAQVDRTFQELVYSFVTGGAPTAAGVDNWTPYTRQTPQRLLIDAACRMEDIDTAQYDKGYDTQTLRLT